MSKKLIRYGLLLVVALIVCQIIKLALYITLLTLAVVFIGAFLIKMQFKKWCNRRAARPQRREKEIN